MDTLSPPATMDGMSPAQSHERHQIIIATELMRRIDDWRRKQPEIPNKSEAIRKLVEIALAVEEGGKGAKK